MTGTAQGPDDDARWRTGRLTAGLAALAGAGGAAVLLVPGWSAHGGPVVLSGATAAVAVLAARHARRLDAAARPVWRSSVVVLGMLALGQLVRGLLGAGVDPVATGPADLVLAATGPATVLLCAQLVRGSGGRLRAPVVLDATVALLALGVLVEFLVPAAPATDPLLTVGYPAVTAVLLAVGLVTFAGVGPARRASAGWLLLCFAALAVVLASGSLAAVHPAPVLDLVTSTAYLAVLGAGARALASHPGPRRPGEEREPAAMPLAGVVVSYCLAFGVVVLLMAGWAAGRPVGAVESAATVALLVLTLLRTLLWAADTARLTRQVQRTESYFRALVDTGADLTIVLDAEHRFTWVSSAGRTPANWTARELQGRPLVGNVHPDDRGDLLRALDRAGEPGAARGEGFRLRTRDGGWRAFEIVHVVTGAALRQAGADAGLVLHLRDVDGRRSSRQELERLAYTDYLTGLPNRARLMEALATARGRAQRGAPSCLLMLDLDGFKAVNDVAGHEAGDLLLVEVAERLRVTVRDVDLVGRLGGDEFAVLVGADLDEATALGERLIAALAGVHRAVPTAGPDPDLVFDVSCSVGVTELSPADDVATTIRQADLALRAAKAAGKGRVRRHGDTADAATARRTRLARDLPEALATGQLRLVYQPVAGLLERRVLGIEALVRWDHPVLGQVSPEEFVPLAEDDGLIVPLQRWVLETATTELAGLLAEGRDLRLGVNISVRHLQAGCLVPDVATALSRSGLPADRLMLEVTESLFIGELDRADGDLTVLHDLGCVISLDDFGRGYSTFAYLARLPVDVLKMDREFLAGIGTDPRSAALVRSVIELGRSLGIDVVAEGVETPTELAALRTLGCRFLQGYLLGRPTPPDRLRAVLDGFDAGLLDAGTPPATLLAAPGERVAEQASA
ncbi:EAL domain-containing protein [Modestobacter sp. NPDC049651]|uniref:putative bifunctional diguanylate cyclase/phosphodiesterase n=1 Tax=unclassified Modestobacter TaxID=2643866 RepID=UPI0033C19A1B